MFCLFQTFRPDSRGTSNRASGTRSGVRRQYSKIFKQLSGINIIEGEKYIQLQIILSPVRKIHQPEKYLLIYCRSGAGCVLEDTELVGGDIPAILGGGFEIKYLFCQASTTWTWKLKVYFHVSGGITLDRDTADECFRRSTTLKNIVSNHNIV